MEFGVSTITGSKHESCGLGEESKNGIGGICIDCISPSNISTTIFIDGLSNGAV